MSFFVLFYLFSIITFSSLGQATQNQEDNHVKLENLSKQTAIWGITEDQLDDLFENSQDYVALVKDVYLYRINKKWTEVLGWTAEELTSRPLLDFVHSEDILSTGGAAQKASKVDCLINFQNRYRTKKGDYHLIEWFSLLQVSGEDRETPVLAIGQDLTLVQAAEQQKYALQEAEAATRLKSTFVAHMSHEIRTPLNGILGFLNLALEEELPKYVRSYIENAQESSQFLLDVANDIIDVSKIEAGVLKIEEIIFNPFKTVESVLSLLNLQANKKGLILKSNIDLVIPPALKGDEHRFKQILLNLVSNAIKFTPTGQVSVKIQGQSQNSSPPTFLLQGKVKDTGIGIDANFLPKMFQPFSQEDHSMRRQFGGAGLGLYITKQLCERMGGDIQVISMPGKGTTFQFQVIFDQPSSPPSHLSQKPTPSLVVPFKTLSEAKVLLVEDNLLNQKVVTFLLKKIGCEVDIANNGLLAVKAVEDKSYDLILMDGEMPIMDGLQATQEIRKRYSAQLLPIIGLSAHALSTHREVFLQAGMNGYLTKPINKETLIEEMTRCLKALSQNTLSKENS